MIYFCLTLCLSLDASFLGQKGEKLHSVRLLTCLEVSVGTDKDKTHPQFSPPSEPPSLPPDYLYFLFYLLTLL